MLAPDLDNYLNPCNRQTLCTNFNVPELLKAGKNIARVFWRFIAGTGTISVYCTGDSNFGLRLLVPNKNDRPTSLAKVEVSFLRHNI